MEKITVLLVEDEQTLAMIIKDTLEGQNFIIHTAADGEEGLRKFFDLRPDVLVADVMMPRMDGFEICLLYTSDAADDSLRVDLGGRRIIKKKFFQAEDGIRDRSPSRGLGDVYKRQPRYCSLPPAPPSTMWWKGLSWVPTIT